MFIKKVFLASSPIHGIGLFAGESIKAGEVIRVPSPLLTLHVHEEVFQSLSVSDQKVIKHYGYRHKDQQIRHFSAEDIRYVNHSEMPAITRIVENDGVCALVDIKKGTELTQNYQDFEELRKL